MGICPSDDRPGPHSARWLLFPRHVEPLGLHCCGGSTDRLCSDVSHVQFSLPMTNSRLTAANTFCDHTYCNKRLFLRAKLYTEWQDPVKCNFLSLSPQGFNKSCGDFYLMSSWHACDGKPDNYSCLTHCTVRGVYMLISLLLIWM